jgi:hypothetical protein
MSDNINNFFNKYKSEGCSFVTTSLQENKVECVGFWAKFVKIIKGGHKNEI